MPDGDPQQQQLIIKENLDPKKVEAAVDEKLKELGFDAHAKEVLARTRDEAKAHREAKERALEEKLALEKRIADFEKAENDRKSEADRIKAEADAAKAAEENAKKSFEEKLASLNDKFEGELTKRDQKAAEEQDKFLKELKARDAKILMQAVIAEANKADILDDSLVSLLDVSDIPMEHGTPDREKIAEMIAKHKEAKPHLYRDPAKDSKQQKETGKEPKRPTDQTKTETFDWSKLDPKEFEAKEKELRRTSNG